MAAASHCIDVYASLPSTEALRADIDLDPTKWHWVYCLAFPLEKLNSLHFSHNTYKWIRYATGVVIGAEGRLSSSSDFFAPVDDTVQLTESVKLYYHTTDQEKRRMFPVDPHIERTHITSSVTTARRETFRDEVAERDGNCCALTSYPAITCDAVHLVPHSKGDKVSCLRSVFPHSPLQSR